MESETEPGSKIVTYGSGNQIYFTKSFEILIPDSSVVELVPEPQEP
jgi:hypothetical protein